MNIKTNESKRIQTNPNEEHNSKKLIIEFNNNLLRTTGKSFEIDAYAILKDDITNYRKLNEYQLLFIEHLTEEQKIEIIKLYDKMINTIKDIV
jgi:hypothetical protein